MNVGVVVTTVCRPDDLALCLEAVVAQSAPPADIVVVQPAPDPRTSEIAATYGARVVRGSARGLPAQKNRGIDALHDGVDLVLFLDDDVVLARDHIEQLLRVFEQDHERAIGGAAGVTISSPAPNPLWLRCWRRVFIGRHPGRPIVTRGAINLAVDPPTDAPLMDAQWLHGAAAYRREIFDTHLFEEALPGYALLEDVDFSYRVGLERRLVIVPSARLEHRQSAVGRVQAHEFGRLFVVNRRWFVRRHIDSARSTLRFWWTTIGFILLWSAAGAKGDAVARARARGAIEGARDALAGRVERPPAPDTGAGTIAVVVATVPGRERDLARCLAGVAAQTRRADEVIVVEGMPSVIAAMRRGLQRARSDWVAFLDDDAIPQSDWLEMLSRHTRDPAVGAVGGRILNFHHGRTRTTRQTRGPVARVTWYGRTVEQLDRIPVERVVEDVEYLRGSNLCLRRVAVPPIDGRLDVGMAPGWELALCSSLRRDGWIIRFDSDALVTHYPAPRPPGLERANRVRYAREYSHVLTYTLVKNLSVPRKFAFLLYFFVIGQRASPGLLFAPYFLLPGRDRARFAAAWAGKIRGLQEAFA